MDLLILLIVTIVLGVLGIILISAGLETAGRRGDILFYSGVILVVLFVILALTSVVLLAGSKGGLKGDGVIIIPIPIYIP